MRLFHRDFPTAAPIGRTEVLQEEVYRTSAFRSVAAESKYLRCSLWLIPFVPFDCVLPKWWFVVFILIIPQLHDSFNRKHSKKQINNLPKKSDGCNFILVDCFRSNYLQFPHIYGTLFSDKMCRRRDLSPRWRYHQVLVKAISWRFKSSCPHHE